MKKIKTYKNVQHFSVESLRLSEYDSWLISFKNRLILQIIEERAKRRMTQKELAVLIGSTQSVVSRIESSSSKNITIDYLLKIISILGVAPGKMLKMAA